MARFVYCFKINFGLSNDLLSIPGQRLTESTPIDMKAAVYDDYGQDLKIVNHPMAQMKDERYLLVRVKAAG